MDKPKVVGSGYGATLMRQILDEQQQRIDEAERVVVVEPKRENIGLGPSYQRPGHRFGHTEMHWARVILCVDGDMVRVVKSSMRDDVRPGDWWMLHG